MDGTGDDSVVRGGGTGGGVASVSSHGERFAWRSNDVHIVVLAIETLHVQLLLQSTSTTHHSPSVHKPK